MIADSLSPPALQLVLDEEFEDMEALGFAVGNWELDFRQLDRGRLKAGASVLAGRHGALLRVRFDRRFHQLGAIPPGLRVFGLPDVDLSWAGAAVGAGTVLDFNSPDGFEGLSPEGFSGLVLMFEEAAWNEIAADEGVVLEPNWGEERRSRSATPATTRLRQRLLAAFRKARQGAPLAALDDEAARTLIGRLAARDRGGVELESGTRRRCVRTAVEFLEDQDRLPVSVADLARVVGVSPATLYRAFRSELGVSPKHYIRARSLAGARRGLLSAPDGARVADVANAWGFWHMSQFAADYRRLFGELPSTTLERRG